jgi:hypothetical protein
MNEVAATSALFRLSPDSDGKADILASRLRAKIGHRSVPTE